MAREWETWRHTPERKQARWWWMENGGSQMAISRGVAVALACELTSYAVILEAWWRWRVYFTICIILCCIHNTESIAEILIPTRHYYDRFSMLTRGGSTLHTLLAPLHTSACHLPLLLFFDNIIIITIHTYNKHTFVLYLMYVIGVPTFADPRRPQPQSATCSTSTCNLTRS